MPTQTIHCADCLDWMRAQPDRLVDLTITSPPYEDRRTYGIGFQLTGLAWVEWCAERVVEMCRLTDGLVLFNASGKVKNWKYCPVVEWLVSELTKNRGIVCGPSPYVFARSGVPGSGSKHYHRRNWEPVYAFALPDRLPVKWSDNLAFGTPPKYGTGGSMSNRHTDGRRLNESTGYRGRRPMPKLANPGNVIACKVGGGHMGSELAHENEAPFPESLVNFFVRSYCPPNGTTFDPFAGSGTTLAVAKKTGRNAIGCEIRPDQCDIVRRRLETIID